MKSDLQMLKEKLDVLLIDMPLTSQEALCLSREIDNLIVEYYRKQIRKTGGNPPHFNGEMKARFL